MAQAPRAQQLQPSVRAQHKRLSHIPTFPCPHAATSPHAQQEQRTSAAAARAPNRHACTGWPRRGMGPSASFRHATGPAPGHACTCWHVQEDAKSFSAALGKRPNQARRTCHVARDAGAQRGVVDVAQHPLVHRHVPQAPVVANISRVPPVLQGIVAQTAPLNASRMRFLHLIEQVHVEGMRPVCWHVSDSSASCSKPAHWQMHRGCLAAGKGSKALPTGVCSNFLSLSSQLRYTALQ